MAIIAAMSSRAVAGDEDGNGHEHDLLMPGFRFHPTEEELIEFYLRRKVEGKRFNVELITFLDLYRHDPWELPGLAAIGDKEWYFYVPRDRKYRNGDRPNRVTSSGYWKATGADRMVKSSDGGGGSGRCSIGLKKTLVFYSGKAPRGTRTCWIMNEYRLPHSSTHQFLKTEISLCRVHKRAGVEDRRLHGQALAAGTLRPSSSGGPSEPLNLIDKKHRSSVDSSPAPLLMETKFPNLLQTAAASNNAVESPMLISDNLYISASSMPNSLRPSTASMEQEASTSSSLALHQYYYPKCSNLIASTNATHVHEGIDELNSLVGMDQLPNQLLQMPHQQTQLPVAFPAISEKLWEWWNPDVPEAGKGFGTSQLYFK